ncbi:MAG: thioredoxin family protein [Dehalococcoidales bacterium]|nr:thioredoxin family protein [Dehalococcoidales bacterium]
MAMISDEDQKFLREHFEKALTNHVTLAFFTQHESKLSIPAQTCMYCKETADLVEEVASLSDRIKVEKYDLLGDAEKATEYGVDKIPATVIVGPQSYGMKFYGIPSGYEFSTFIEDIISASTGESGLSDKTKQDLQKITEDTHIQVFVTPT